MKRNSISKKIIACLLVVLLVLGTAPGAFAAEIQSDNPTPGIVYKGKYVSAIDRWLYKDVDATYTATDLFTGFKGVMPGDTLVQDFVVKNEAGKSIKLFMEVVPHDEANGLSDGVAAKTTTAQMIQFLNQMPLVVTAGEGEKEVTLFNIPKGELGTFAGKADLGILQAGYGAELHVKLVLPIEVDNTFANAIGEVDFKFIVEEQESGGGGGIIPDPDEDEEIDDPEVPKTEPDEPEEPTVIPGVPVEDIDDPEAPLGDAPKTGDTTRVLPFVMLMIAALAGMVVTRKKLN